MLLNHSFLPFLNLSHHLILHAFEDMKISLTWFKSQVCINYRDSLHFCSADYEI